MRFRTIALVTAVALAAPVAAQQQAGPPGARDAKRVTAGTYALDPRHTLIEWRVNHWGITDYFGLFGDISGTLTLDPANPSAAKVDVTIPVSKVVTANAALTEHLLKPADPGKKADFFGAAPADARFVSKRVTASGTNATIVGDLSLNGVTKEVTLAASFYGAGTNPRTNVQMLGFSAKAKIKRTDFGIAFGLPNVSDEVTLDISAAFDKK